MLKSTTFSFSLDKNLHEEFKNIIMKKRLRANSVISSLISDLVQKEYPLSKYKNSTYTHGNLDGKKDFINISVRIKEPLFSQFKIKMYEYSANRSRVIRDLIEDWIAKEGFKYE